MGEIQTKIPTEVQLTERREYELSEQGFIGLTWRKGSDNAAFFSANSARSQVLRQQRRGKAAETNYRLGTQLPYMFVVTRLSHYMKVLQREQMVPKSVRISSVSSTSGSASTYPIWTALARGSVTSTAPQGRDCRGRGRRTARLDKVLLVQPHFKYMGASFELSLVGKLDKS